MDKVDRLNGIIKSMEKESTNVEKKIDTLKEIQEEKEKDVSEDL